MSLKRFQQWYGSTGRNLRVSTEEGGRIPIPKALLEEVWLAASSDSSSKETVKPEVIKTLGVALKNLV